MDFAPYADWQRVLEEAFFSPDWDGHPVIMYVDDRVAEQLRDRFSLAVPLAEAVRRRGMGQSERRQRGQPQRRPDGGAPCRTAGECARHHREPAVRLQPGRGDHRLTHPGVRRRGHRSCDRRVLFSGVRPACLRRRCPSLRFTSHTRSLLAGVVVRVADCCSPCFGSGPGRAFPGGWGAGCGWDGHGVRRGGGAGRVRATRTTGPSRSTGPARKTGARTNCPPASAAPPALPNRAWTTPSASGSAHPPEPDQQKSCAVHGHMSGVLRAELRGRGLCGHLDVLPTCEGSGSALGIGGFGPQGPRVGDVWGMPSPAA